MNIDGTYVVKNAPNQYLVVNYFGHFSRRKGNSMSIGPASANQSTSAFSIMDLVEQVIPLVQLDVVLADGKISVAELRQYPELKHHIEVTLGYSNIAAFVSTHGRVTNQSTAEIQLSRASIEAIRASISGSIAPVDVYSANATTRDLPTNIDTASTFVVFKLPGGQKITFDGPEAGHLANEFATIYNNSKTFRSTITSLAKAQGGQYSFHSLPLEITPAGQTVGLNFSGVAGVGSTPNSGIFIQSNGEVDFSVAATIIHEVAHDLHDYLDFGSHSREQTLFHSTIVNELSESGVDIHFDVDGGDYSHDALVFNTEFDSEDDYSTGSVKSVNSSGKETDELEDYKSLYQHVASLIDQGKYKEAAYWLHRIPAHATVTLAFENPQTGEVSEVIYNVRALFFQDLLLSADSVDRFDTGGSNDQDKKNLAGFLNYLTSSDPELAESVKSAAKGIRFDLAAELPTYRSDNRSDDDLIKGITENLRFG